MVDETTAIEVSARKRFLQGRVGRQATVSIDGREVGTVRYKSSHRFPVAPGRHQVEVTIRWLGTDKGRASAPVDVAEGSTATLAYRTPWNALGAGSLT